MAATTATNDGERERERERRRAAIKTMCRRHNKCGQEEEMMWMMKKKRTTTRQQEQQQQLKSITHAYARHTHTLTHTLKKIY